MIKKETKLYVIIVILTFILATTTSYIIFSEKNKETTDTTGIQEMYERFLEQEKEQTEYFKNKYYNAQLFYMTLWNETIDCHEMKFPFII